MSETVVDAQIIGGDARQVLPALPAACVQTVVTSPPYFGLRDYGVDGQIGLESTPDAYVAQLVAVFREVRRVLNDDGTVWLNLGDSYANNAKWGGSSGGLHAAELHGNTGIGRGKKHTGLKGKDLIGIPWRVAFALQADGWYLRSDIIWHKPNPMPESVTDRPTKSHEYLFLLAKSERYHYDHMAIAEPANYPEGPRQKSQKYTAAYEAGDERHRTKAGLSKIGPRETRNKRTVWSIQTQPFKGAHFATMPEKLVEPCVLAGSRPGDIVLDPFAGSCTVGVVATHHGRAFLGIELNPAYVELGQARLAVGAKRCQPPGVEKELR